MKKLTGFGVSLTVIGAAAIIGGTIVFTMFGLPVQGGRVIAAGVAAASLGAIMLLAIHSHKVSVIPYEENKRKNDLNKKTQERLVS